MAERRKPRRSSTRKSPARTPPARSADEAPRLRRELADALDREAATREILTVISRSPTDVEAVFAAIVRTAVRLCGAAFGTVSRFDGKRLRMAAQQGLKPETIALAQQSYTGAANPG
jgi:hypothetical protein